MVWQICDVGFVITIINQHILSCVPLYICSRSIGRVVLGDHDLTTHQGTEVIRGVSHVVEVWKVTFIFLKYGVTCILVNVDVKVFLQYIIKVSKKYWSVFLFSLWDFNCYTLFYEYELFSEFKIFFLFSSNVSI